MLLSLFNILTLIVPLLISVAYFTLAERKILGAIQRRKGPNVIGVWGLLQPLSDGLKLFVKESIIPNNSDSYIFFLSPILTFIISLLAGSVIPFSEKGFFVDFNIGLIYILAISSLGIYGIILSGWSSNSKYAFLGALRSTAQMVSYEVSIGFIILPIVLSCGSFDLQVIVLSQKYFWYVAPFLPLFLMFFTSALAETNRHPFDLPEAEAELVSGYNVEYSSMSFALFSLGEYSNMLSMCLLNVILFFGGWLSPIFFFHSFFWFGLKVIFFVFLYVLLRAALPRYRYDQLMSLGWKIFLPASLSFFGLVSNFLFSFNLFPF